MSTSVKKREGIELGVSGVAGRGDVVLFPYIGFGPNTFFLKIQSGLAKTAYVSVPMPQFSCM